MGSRDDAMEHHRPSSADTAARGPITHPVQTMANAVKTTFTS